MKYMELNVIANRNFAVGDDESKPPFTDFPNEMVITLKMDLIQSIRPGSDGKTLVELQSGRTWVVIEPYIHLKTILIALKDYN